jgi:hypothetical protein
MLLSDIFTRLIRTVLVMDYTYNYKTSKYLDSLRMFKELCAKVFDFIEYIKGTILGSLKEKVVRI